MAERYCANIDQFERELATLPFEAARSRAEQLLARSTFLRTITWDSDPPVRTDLAPEVGSFVHRIRRIEAIENRDERYIDSSDISPFTWLPEYLCFGMDDEHIHVALRPNDETIYLLADDVSMKEALQSTLPTVYHWILYCDRSQELLSDNAG